MKEQGELISDFYSATKTIDNAEQLVVLYLRNYFNSQEIIYQITSFQLLVD